MKTVGISATFIGSLVVLVGLWAFRCFEVFRSENRISVPQPQRSVARNPNDERLAPVTSAFPSTTTIDPPLTHPEPSPARKTADRAVDLPPDMAASMVIAKTMPSYPPLAKAAGVSGSVEMLLRVSKNGEVSDLRVISGPTALRQSALDAGRTWRYRPYILNGYPVEFQTTAKVTFSLER